MKLPLVVLCSGRGTNLQAMLDASRQGALPIELRAVLSDKPHCAALQRARAAGIDARALRPRDFADRAAFDQALFAEAAARQPALIVLAGYMRIIDAGVVGAWHGRMINIHPSLLPKHPGLHTHAAALAAGDSEHGASVHFVTGELDGGPVIAQVATPVTPRDDAVTLAQRLLPLEHRLLVATLALFARGAIGLDAGARVLYRETALRAPLRLDVATGRLAPG